MRERRDDWSLNLTAESGFLAALIVGLAVGSFFLGVSTAIEEATRPEWRIKAAMVPAG